MVSVEVARVRRLAVRHQRDSSRSRRRRQLSVVACPPRRRTPARSMQRAMEPSRRRTWERRVVVEAVGVARVELVEQDPMCPRSTICGARRDELAERGVGGICGKDLRSREPEVVEKGVEAVVHPATVVRVTRHVLDEVAMALSPEPLSLCAHLLQLGKQHHPNPERHGTAESPHGTHRRCRAVIDAVDRIALVETARRPAHDQQRGDPGCRGAGGDPGQVGQWWSIVPSLNISAIPSHASDSPSHVWRGSMAAVRASKPCLKCSRAARHPPSGRTAQPLVAPGTVRPARGRGTSPTAG